MLMNLLVGIFLGFLIFILIVVILFGILWLLVPSVVRYKEAPMYDASYEPKGDKIREENELTLQNCIPEVIINESTGSIQVKFGENRILDDFCVRLHYNNEWYSSFNEEQAVQTDTTEQVDQVEQTCQTEQADQTEPADKADQTGSVNKNKHKQIRLLSYEKKDKISTNLGFATVYTFDWGFEGFEILNNDSWEPKDFNFEKRTKNEKYHDLVFYTSVIVYPNSNYVIFDTSIPFYMPKLKTGIFEQANVIFPSFVNRSPNQRIVTFHQDCFCVPRRDFRVIFGPVCLFDDQKNTIIMSALDNFITNCIEKEEVTINQMNTDDGGKEGVDITQRYSFGVNGQVDILPKHYTHSFIVIFHHGINESFRLWGSLLRKYNGVRLEWSDKKTDNEEVKKVELYPDIINSYLGYFTDNGADYYYRTIRGMKADATLIEVKNHAEKLGIPYQFYQLDSWWYQKTVKKGRHQRLIKVIGTFFGGFLYGGATLWEPDKKYLDMDLPELYQQLGNKPFVAHGRWFLQESPYVKKFKFITENEWAMPDDPNFWDHIMRYCKENHIVVYEQDWMVSQLRHFTHLRSQVGKAEEWLRNMAESAKKYGITIQYCMEIPTMLMFAINHPQVTHVRSSNDYNARWPHAYDIPFFTQSAMLADALGLRPFKDVFKSTRRGRINGERCPELECLISALSTGPVTPGDRIGYMNKQLLDAACRPDGLLLKPDRAITAVDLCYIKNSTYYICTTESKHQDFIWHYVLTANYWPHRVTTPYYSLRDIDIVGTPQIGMSQKYVEYDWFSKKSRVVSDLEPISYRLKYEQYKYCTYSPLVADKYALMGNLQKFATMNFIQFSEVTVNNDTIRWNLSGIENETIEVSIYARELPSRLVIDSEEFKIEETTLADGSIQLNSWIQIGYDKNNNIMKITITFEQPNTVQMGVK
jgi:hypothetical protein